MSSAKCSNKHNDKPVQCLQEFIDKIQGIHQLTQNDKIPIICWYELSLESILAFDLNFDSVLTVIIISTESVRQITC